MKFDKNDLGRQIILVLNADKDPLGRTLDSSEAIFNGTIAGIGESSLRVTMSPAALKIYGSSKRRTYKIEYKDIKGYTLL